MWFALILVSLKHWKQQRVYFRSFTLVVICSHFSIFETLETTTNVPENLVISLWFALILVSLKHWKQLIKTCNYERYVVICSHFSIFETLETTDRYVLWWGKSLWFALILVSLKHWKQLCDNRLYLSVGCDLLSF